MLNFMTQRHDASLFYKFMHFWIQSSHFLFKFKSFWKDIFSKTVHWKQTRLFQQVLTIAL